MDSVNEYLFFHNGNLVKSMPENIANKVFAESVNAFGVYYDGNLKTDVEYQAKGEVGVIEFDFKWTSYAVKPRILQ